MTNSRAELAPRPDRRRRRIVLPQTVAALATVVVVGSLDRVVGREIGLALLYLVPIGAAGWWIGRTPAAVVALVAAAFWIHDDLANNAYVLTAPTLWNGFTRIVIFLFAGVVLAELRRDLRELQRLLAREAELAQTDALTGLPNSRAFLAAVERALASADRSGARVAIAYVDLDNFKQVNDRYGHGRGDLLLREAAERLANCVRRNDFAARLAGDEFAILFDQSELATVDAVTERLVEAIGSLGAELPDADLSVSIGLATGDASTSAEELLRRADDAMYHAKRSGKGRVSRSALDSVGTDE